MSDYIHTLFNAFGGKIPVIFLVLFVMLLTLITSMIKKRSWRICCSILASLYIVLETVSLFFTQHFISYSFFVHFNLRGVQGESWMFIPHFLFALFIWGLLTWMLIHSNKILASLNKKSIYILLFLGIILISIAGKNSTYITDKKILLATLFSNKHNDFSPSITELGMKTYTLPEDITAKKGKNIIVLSIESLELGFLSEKYAHITPNLNKLRDSWNFIEIEPTLGCGWTSASLYAALTGFPAFFGTGGTQLFSNVYNTNISSITHALEKAGYQTIFIGGDTDHAGTIDILNTFGFDKVLDYKNTKSTGHESNYGLRDKEVMELAESTVNKFHENNEPFALFVSTIDTHFPNGIYDKRFEDLLPPQDSELTFMVSVIDYLIGSFIEHLKELDLLANTSIYIFPDHLKMGDPTIFDKTGERKLYLLSNSKIANQQKRNYYQIDLPRMILEGAEVEHNMHFLSDYINIPINSYILQNIATITTVNTAGIQQVSRSIIQPKKTKQLEKYIADTTRFIAHAGGAIHGKIYTNSLDALNHSYKNGFRLMELDLTFSKDSSIIALHDWELWRVMIRNRSISTPVSTTTFLETKLYDSILPLDIEGINTWFSEHHDAVLVTDKFEHPTLLSKLFIDKNRLMMEMNHEDSIERAIELGILGVMLGEVFVRKADPKKIRQFFEKGVKYAVVSRSFIHEYPHKTRFMKGLGIKIYIHNPEYENGIDLNYMINYELDYVYGVYADEWHGGGSFE